MKFKPVSRRLKTPAGQVKSASPSVNPAAGTPAARHTTPARRSATPRKYTPSRPPTDIDEITRAAARLSSSIPYGVVRLNPAGLPLELTPAQYEELQDDIRFATILTLTKIAECIEACIVTMQFMARKKIPVGPYMRAGVRVVRMGDGAGTERKKL